MLFGEKGGFDADQGYVGRDAQEERACDTHNQDEESAGEEPRDLCASVLVRLSGAHPLIETKQGNQDRQDEHGDVRRDSMERSGKCKFLP